ncbi:MAG: heme NO-binding domain-containing protein [Roseibium sp.]
MKGIVFTEFFDLVDETFGPAVTEATIVDAGLPNEGAYTGVGNYAAAEMQVLVECLSARTGVPVRDLLLSFGRHLLTAFSCNHAKYFDSCGHVFDLVESVEEQIHVDVRKLYPDAELPSLVPTREDDRTISLLYRSRRKMADLAEGLLLGAIDHFGDAVDLGRIDLPEAEGEQCVCFKLRRR